MISSLHECIARKLVTNYRSKCSNEGDKTESFDVWCESLKSSENKNETSRFWAQMFDLLNAYMAYYFSKPFLNFSEIGCYIYFGKLEKLSLHIFEQNFPEFFF